MAGHGGDEDVALERPELRVDASGHRGGARDVAQKRDLAEIATAAQCHRRPPLRLHRHFAPLDHVEAVAGIAFAEDDGAGGDTDVPQMSGELLQRDRRQRRGVP